MKADAVKIKEGVLLGWGFRLGYKNLSWIHLEWNNLQCLLGIWRG